MSERIVLLDSSGVLHRCFHGYPHERLANVDGKKMDVAGVYGYVEHLRKIANEFEYDRLIHIMDPDGGSAHRFAMYPQYKGKRSPTHPVLCAQKALLQMVLESLNQTVVRINGVESDDVIASLAQKFYERGDEVLILTSDKDLMQLVKDGKVVLARYVEQGPGLSKTYEFYEEQDVQQKFGVRPDQIADWLALVGDAVDNIPGVPKVGEKTATKWLEQYGSLASLMTHADEIKGSLGERLRENLSDLPLYRQLTGMIPIQIDIPEEHVSTSEQVKWARDILQLPAHWPDDINGDLREEVPSPSRAPRP